MQKILPEEELIRMMVQFYGREFTDASQEKKQEYIDDYRKVEEDTNKQIEAAGGVQNWYMSGQGRLLDL